MSATLAQLTTALARKATVAYGTTPAFLAYVATQLLPHGPVVIVTPDEASARQMAADARFFAPSPEAIDPAAPATALRIPGVDTSPYAELSPDRAALAGRMAALYRLARGGVLRPPIAVVSATSLVRRVIAPAELLELSIELTVHADINREATAERLTRAGYARMSIVEDPGTFAVRGGVVDVFCPLYPYPVRIELFGDEIESMRLFDPQSQRTLRAIERLHLHPVRETVLTRGADVRAKILAAADAATMPSKQTRRVLEQLDTGEEFVGIETLTPVFHARMTPLWQLLGDTAQWLVLDPDGVIAAATDELDIAASRYQDRLADGRLALAPSEHYVALEELASALSAPRRRVLARTVEMLGADEDAAVLRFAIDGNRGLRSALERARKQSADELLQPLTASLGAWRKGDWRIAIPCDSAARADRLAGLLSEYDVFVERASQPIALDALSPGVPTLLRGSLSEGFSYAAEGLAIVTDDEIFGARRQTSVRQRAAAKRARDALLGGVADFSQLAVGDFLVHHVHGVGQYQGLKKLPLRGAPMDFLQLEYSGGTLYLPVYRLSEVQRYVGAEGHSPRLDKLGGLTWDKARRKVSVQVRALAEELLQLYAQRAALPGHAFPAGDAMFGEFEALFEFEETPDQQKAIDAVIDDMESPRPMDRLVCGDVGYGKTEVALRAALKAVLGGKQVAMLAPTTVLVEQHFQTMKRRYAGWPVQVERLSRFQSRASQLAAIKGLAAGTVDIVVGTHRLLSKDVRFKELGLLIIDEEQRFGVTQKERLKKLRTQLDVLTLTATPIPRTLHLAMAGLRDLSIIATPPADRRSIRTFVSRVDDGVLREALRRELGRGGQCFFVSPRIGDGKSREPTLEDWATHLRALVPEARVVVAHGQMSAEALETIMVGFVNGEHDVLVSTTIIESGLDIARANTMFIARADTFGVSQLYQLRGRIGRSKERAFCYLLVPPPEQLTEEARRRLEALQRYTELGAGFQIASHDLEIRGAGELLGAKQSGSIAAVGFETYTAMLEEAVAELRGEEIHKATDPELNVDAAGFIPDDYVPDTGQRLDLYKRLSGAEDEDEVRLLLDELLDRYGPLPLEVVQLGDLMVLKTYARVLRAVSVDLTATRMTLALAETTPLSPTVLAELVKRSGKQFRLTADGRLACQLPSTEQGPAHAARSCLLELIGCAT